MSQSKDVKVMTVGGHSFVIGKTGLASQTLRFRISAKALLDTYSIGSTDPYVKVFVQQGDSWNLIGTSEVIKNSLNPTWSYVFEDQPYARTGKQFWKIEVWDHDQVGSDDFVGETIVSIDTYHNESERITVPLSTKGSLTVFKA